MADPDSALWADAFERQRPRLRSIAYRVLGSVADAEDVVQEAWLRLSRTDASAIENLEAWLTTVTTRLALNALRGPRPVDGGFLPEPVVDVDDDAHPEREALIAHDVGVALQVVLDMLSPAERVAFVLHDVFDVPFDQIATTLDRSPAAVRQLASRARRAVRDAAPQPDESLSAQRAVVNAYFEATRHGDLDALVVVLDPDVVLRSHRRGAPPLQLDGVAAVANGAVAAKALARDVRPALINGAAGIVAFDADGAPFAILAFTVVGGRIVTIDVFNDAEGVSAIIGRSRGV